MDKKQAKVLMEQVRDILNEWDFLSVVEIGPKDEYDCMIGPLVHILLKNSDREVIKEYILNELKSHFGLIDYEPGESLETAINKLAELRG